MASCNLKCSTGTIRAFELICSSLLLVACSTAPRISESHLSREVFTSSDGQLHYRIPVGWINATNDSSSVTNIIWLVRSDFTSTLSVREVSLDSETRREVNRLGLNRVADLTLALASSVSGARIVQQPEPASLNGNKAFRYAYIAGNSSDVVHVIVFDTGRNVYSVSLLVSTKMGQGSVQDAVAMETAFVQELTW